MGILRLNTQTEAAARRLTLLRQRRRRRRTVAFGLFSSVVIATTICLPYREVEQDDNHSGTLRYGYVSEEWRDFEKSVISPLLFTSDVEYDYQISQYDELFQRISTPFDINWCLMSAISFVESRFDSDARSNTGAVGLMQIMPRIGRHYGFSVKELSSPSTNILAANMLFVDIERMLDIPNETPERDRISLILASYNGGIARVFDAQRLARARGGDPHKWSDVSRQILSLRFPDSYNHKSVRYGRFGTATYTVAYVRDVMKKYDEFLKFSKNCSYYLYPTARNYEELDDSLFWEGEYVEPKNR